MEPLVEAMTGAPQHMASTSGRPNPSYHDGKTNTVARFISATRSLVPGCGRNLTPGFSRAAATGGLGDGSLLKNNNSVSARKACRKRLERLDEHRRVLDAVRKNGQGPAKEPRARLVQRGSVAQSTLNSLAGSLVDGHDALEARSHPGARVRRAHVR